MLVTNVCEYKGDTWEIELDSERKFFVNLLIVENFHIEKGQTLTLAALEQIKGADILRKAKKRALYLVGERAYCYKELFSKLKRTYNEEVAREAADYILDLGYINDSEYAPKLAEYLIKSKRFGVRKAEYEMLRRGLDSELVRNTLAEYTEEELDGELMTLIERKYSAKLSDFDDRRRTTQALIRRGYDYGAVKRCIEAVLENV